MQCDLTPRSSSERRQYQSRIDAAGSVAHCRVAVWIWLRRS